MIRAFIALALLSIFAACSDRGDNYRYEGAGLSLYSETSTSKTTQNLLKYFDELCGQAAIGLPTTSKDGQQSYSCPSPLTSQQYSKLMQTGFNDIDLRCDQYLGWIDRKRIEALTYHRGAGAINSLIGAGLLIGGADPDAFAALLAAFSFSSNIYDASNTSLLAALESSTIKTLVYKRQKAFRAAANRHSGRNASRESVVFALRNYLLICTPQTIVLDANTFSRDPSAGSPATLEKGFNEQFSAFSPVRGGQSFGGGGNVGKPVGQTCKGREKVFSDKPETYLCGDIKIAQRLLCFIPSRGLDGDPGPATTAAIREFEIAQLGRDQAVTDPKQEDGLLSQEEFRALGSAGCQSDEGSFYRSVYERSIFGQDGDDTNRETAIELLNFCFKDLAPISAGAKTNDKRFRTRIKMFRTKFDIEPQRGELITRDLFSQLGDAQTLCQ